MNFKKHFAATVLAVAASSAISADVILLQTGSSNANNEPSLARKAIYKAARVGFYGAELATGVASLNWHLMKQMTYADAWKKLKNTDSETMKKAAVQTAADVYEANVIAARAVNARLPQSVQQHTAKLAPVHAWVINQFPTEDVVDINSTVKTEPLKRSIAADGQISDQSKHLALWATHLALISHASHGLYKELVAPLIK